MNIKDAQLSTNWHRSIQWMIEAEKVTPLLSIAERDLLQDGDNWREQDYDQRYRE
jgi:hypothetical protein